MCAQELSTCSLVEGGWSARYPVQCCCCDQVADTDGGPPPSTRELNLTIQEVYTSWRQDSPVEHKLHPAQRGRKQRQAYSVPPLGPSGLGEDR